MSNKIEEQRNGTYFRNRLKTFTIDEVRIAQNLPHIFENWLQIMGACYDPLHPKFREEGAKGISVCKEWRDDVVKFAEDVIKIGEN